MNLIMTDRSLDVSCSESENIKIFNLSEMKIHNCIGCFGCWTKTPGRCVIRDEATLVYPSIAEAENVMYVSRIKYGSYDTCMKKMLERAIPVQQAFIRIHNGETHHVQRAVREKTAVIIAYGDNLDDEEKQIFIDLIERNKSNMSFRDYKILFAKEEEVSKIVGEQVEKWEKQS